MTIESAKIIVKADIEQTKSLDLSTPRNSLDYSMAKSLTDGSGADKAQVAFSDSRTLAASASEELDLAGGLTDAFGQTITFTKIKYLIIQADSGNTNDVLVGGAAANGFASFVDDSTDVVVVRPGGIFVIGAPDATGLAVTADTADLLKIANSAGDTEVTYDIVIIGEGGAA